MKSRLWMIHPPKDRLCFLLFFVLGWLASGSVWSAPAVDCSAVTTVNFYGNLDAGQRADQPGGILDLGFGPDPVLPIMTAGGALNGMYANLISYGGGTAIAQIDTFNQGPQIYPGALPNHDFPLDMMGDGLDLVQSSGVTSYAWNQVPALPPACVSVKTVIDSIGNPRELTFYFYQVNDLGTAVPPINPNPPHQVLYAWYAFETTGGQTPGNSNLVGGTGIMEGDISGTCPYDRGIPGDWATGDMLFFNADGSLDSEGGSLVDSGSNSVQAKPIIYLPPAGPNGVLQVRVNFGTAGMPGYGLRDGLTGDVGPCTCGSSAASIATPTPTPTNTPSSTLTPTLTASPSNTPTPSPTATSTKTPTTTPTLTITPTPGLVVNCSAVTMVHFYGNLDAGQRADQPGGILNLGDSTNPVLPMMASGGGLNSMYADLIPYGLGIVVNQVDTFNQGPDGPPDPALPNHDFFMVSVGGSLALARSSGVTSYAWNQTPALPPACITVKTVVDSIGNPRELTFYFYQVNDLGTAVPPVNPNPPHQVLYAWYAFETTGGQTPGNGNLIGGTGIMEGNASGTCPYDRGTTGGWGNGDLIFFNADGSLDSEGGVWIDGSGLGAQSKSILYLPPSGPNGVLQVQVDFGTAGMPGYGLRDGLTGDPGPCTCGNTAAAPTFTPTWTPTVTPTLTPVPAGTPVACGIAAVNPGSPSVLSMSDGTTIHLPAGSFAQPVTLTVCKYASASAPPVSAALLVQFLSYVYVIDSGGFEPAASASITVTLPYNPADIPSPYTAADLSLSYFDGTQWVVLPSAVDTVNHTITVVTNHFSWWAVVLNKQKPTPTVFPEGNKPVIYPNPATGGQVKVALPMRVAGDVKIQIFTLSYRKVKELTVRNVQPGTAVTVDLLDKAGVGLANGLYFLAVTYPDGGRKTVKLIVIR